MSDACDTKIREANEDVSGIFAVFITLPPSVRRELMAALQQKHDAMLQTGL